MAATMPKDIKSKFDQIVRDLFVKSIQIILQSRIPVTGQSSAESTASPSSSASEETREDRRFYLALQEFPTDVDALEACKRNGFRSVVLDVLLMQFPHRQTELSFKHGKLHKFWKTVMSQQPDRRSVLERWVLQYVNHEDGQNAEKQISGIERMIARVFKSTMVFLRSLFSMTRLLPAYRAFQLANTSSYGKFFGLSYRVLPLPRPLLHGEAARMKSYKFTSIEAPFGKICLSVDYRSLVASDFNFPSVLGLPKIVPDYYRGGSTTDPVKILSDDCYSKNMMLNFGGSLPLIGSVLSAPPDIHRNGDSNYCKFATISPRHSYIQRALQTIPLSCSRSCRCSEFSAQEQLHCGVLRAKQTEGVTRTFPVDKSTVMFSGAYDYCREAEVAVSLPFAIDNDSSVNLSSSLASRQSAQINETMAKEATTLQIPREAAIGAIVELLQSAPPLRQFTALDSSGDLLKLRRPSFEKDGNIHVCPCKAHTSGFPVENSYFKLSNSLKQEVTSSCSKTTLGQALKELDVFKGIKNQILNKQDNDSNKI